MASFATIIKANPGEKISGYSFGYSAPEYFRDWVNDKWQRGRPGAIVDCVAEPRTPEAWKDLGQFLIHELRSMGRFVGMFAACNQELPPLQSWLRAASAKVGGEVQPEWGTAYGVGYVVQSAYHADWLTGLWNQTESAWFDFGIGLMLTVYDTREREELLFDEVDTMQLIKALGKSLRRAVAWLVPWDGNIGFQLGLPVESDLYRRLAAHSSAWCDQLPWRCLLLSATRLGER
jgi:hypothetical protein